MKMRHLLLGLICGIIISGVTWSWAQPKLPQEKIPGDLSPEVKIQVERLYAKDPVQRAYAILNLKKMGNNAAAAVPFLVAMLDDKFMVRITSKHQEGPGKKILTQSYGCTVGILAAEALGQMGEAGSSALIKALKKKNPDIRANAANGLGDAKVQWAVAPLLANLRDKEEYVRDRAASALGKINNEPARAGLRSALQDKNPKVRQAAAVGLGASGDKNAVAPLSTALKDKDRLVRYQAAKALRWIPDPLSVAPLVAALQDKDYLVRYQAGQSLGRLRYPEAVEPLIALLQDKNLTVRREVVFSLGLLKDKRAVSPLIAALQDKDPAVKSNARSALFTITGKKFGADHQKWLSWWQENQGKVQPPQ